MLPALFFLRTALAIRVFSGPIQILRLFSLFLWKCHWNYERDSIGFIDGFV